MPIDWDSDPEVAAHRNKWQLARVPRAGKIDGIILSPYCEAVWTHYWGGRTQPCRGIDCEACQAQGARRRHVYLGIWRPDNNSRALFECTDLAGVEILQKKATGESLRGVKIRAVRLNAKPNAPVEITLGEDLSGTYQLPKEPDIRDALRIIWHLSHDPSAYEEAEKGTRVRPHIRRAKKIDGTGNQKANEAARVEQPGGHWRSNGIHQQTKGSGDFPAGPAFEPTHD